MRFRSASLILLIMAGIWFWATGSKRPRSVDPQADLAEKTVAGATDAAAPHTNVARAPANAALTGRPTVEQFAQSIREDRYCTDSGYFLSDKWFTSPGDRRQFLYEALVLANRDQTVDPCVRALLTRDRAEAIRLNESSSATACRFSLALILTRQMEFDSKDAPPTAEERAQGTAILRELMEGDPTNGIYSYFLVGALTSAEPTPEKGDAIRAFLQADHYDNPIPGLWARVYELAEKSPTANLYMAEIGSALNFPSYLTASREIKTYIANYGTADTADTMPWMQNLIGFIDKVDGARLHEPFVALIDLSVMRGLAKSFWQTAGREEADLPERLGQDWWAPFFRRVARSDDIEYFPMHDPGCRELHKFAKDRHVSSTATFWDEKRRAEKFFER